MVIDKNIGEKPKTGNKRLGPHIKSWDGGVVEVYT